MQWLLYYQSIEASAIKSNCSCSSFFTFSPQPPLTAQGYINACSECKPRPAQYSPSRGWITKVLSSYAEKKIRFKFLALLFPSRIKERKPSRRHMHVCWCSTHRIACVSAMGKKAGETSVSEVLNSDYGWEKHWPPLVVGQFVDRTSHRALRTTVWKGRFWGSCGI